MWKVKQQTADSRQSAQRADEREQTARAETETENTIHD